MFKKQHVHVWEYMFSSANNDYQWFHCPLCLAQAVTKLEGEFVSTPMVFEVKPKPKPKKKW